MKRFSVLLPLVAVLMCFAQAMSAQQFVYDGLKYNILSAGDHTVELTRGSTVPENGHVVVPAQVSNEGQTYSVVRIGSWALSSNKTIVALEMPSSVVSIGGQAFVDCTNLKDIVWSSSLGEIGSFAFSQCSGLTEIVFPDGLESLGESSFLSCEGLVRVEIPGSVKNVGKTAFSGCKNLTTAVLAEGVESVGESSFTQCDNLSEVVFPSTLESISRNAFYACPALKEVRLPMSLTWIGNDAFNWRTAQSTVYAPWPRPIAIGEDAFTNIELHVPVNTSAYYKAAADWQDYRWNIVEDASLGTYFDIALSSEGDGTVRMEKDGAIWGYDYIAKGESINIVAEPAAGSELKTLTVNGTDVTEAVSGGIYTIESVEAMLDVRAEFGPAEYVWLSVLQADCGAVSVKVRAGEAAILHISSGTGWKVNSVSLDGTDVTADLGSDGMLTTAPLRRDATVNVSFEAESESSVADFGLGDRQVKAYASADAIRLEGLGDGELVSVYNMAGVKLAEKRASGPEMSFTGLEKAVYLVKTSQKAIKIAL